MTILNSVMSATSNFVLENLRFEYYKKKIANPIKL